MIFRIAHSLALACLVLVTCAQAAAPSGELVLAAGSRAPAFLFAIDSAWKLAFRAEKPRAEIAAAEIVTWGTLPSMDGGGVILLADGGQLYANLRKFEEQQSVVTSVIFGDITIPSSQLRGIVLRSPSNFSARDQLIERVLSIKVDQDWLFLENGDELSGKVRSLDAATLRFASEVGETSIPLDKIVALALNSSPPVSPIQSRLGSIMGWSDGSWFTCQQAVTKTAKAANSTTVVQFVAEGGWSGNAPLDDLVFLQPLGGAVRYLSDEKALSYKHIPFLTMEWPFRTDRSVIGGLLRFDDRVYPKGLGMHSTSRVTYALTPTDGEFAAEIALDRTADLQGSVTFRVFVDNEQRYASPIVRGGDPPVPVSVDVSGGKRLSLIVDFAERGDELDRANWLNARLRQKP